MDDRRTRLALMLFGAQAANGVAGADVVPISVFLDQVALIPEASLDAILRGHEGPGFVY